MKIKYESAELNIVFFDKTNVITASAEETSSSSFAPSYEIEDNETEIL